MANKIDVERNKVGLEDIAFGVGTETQSRNGKDIIVTKINAKNLPFDDTRNLEQALRDEKAVAFANFNINDNGDLIATYSEEGIFSINSEGEFILNY
jgi:hypothetical protein